MHWLLLLLLLLSYAFCGWPWVTCEGHFSNLLDAVTLCAQLTRDLLAIAKFLVNRCFGGVELVWNGFCWCCPAASSSLSSFCSLWFSHMTLACRQHRTTRRHNRRHRPQVWPVTGHWPLWPVTLHWPVPLTPATLSSQH